MRAAIDILRPDSPKRLLIVASNPAVSQQTGWPIGFWWGELTHPCWEFTERGYTVDVASPEGGQLEGDAYSDPRDASGYSADDLLSLGFISSPEHARLVEQSKPLADVAVDDYDAVLLVGGQGPMYTFWNDERVETDRLVLFVEGKRTETLSKFTAWFPARDQLTRNLDLVGEVSPDNLGFVLLAVEEPVEEPSDDQLRVAAPHLGCRAAEVLRRRYLGQVSWSRLCQAAGVDYDSLPDQVPAR
jgi:putative intracellular protease/amidase